MFSDSRNVKNVRQNLIPATAYRAVTTVTAVTGHFVTLVKKELSSFEPCICALVTRDVVPEQSLY